MNLPRAMASKIDSPREVFHAAPPARSLRGASSRWKRLWPLLPVLAFLLAFLIYPMLGLFSLSFIDTAGHPSLMQFRLLIERAVYLRVMQTSFLIAGWTTVICLVLGYPVAYMLAQAGDRIRNKLLIVVLMPFWTGLLVRTIAWMILLSDSGPLRTAARSIGIIDLPLMHNLAGVLISMTHAFLPIGILSMFSVMRSIDRNLVNAAVTLGAPRSQAFWRIYFPLSIPGIAAGGLIIFITALGNFVSPIILGGPRETMIAQVIITQLQELMNWGFAGALSIVLLVSTLVVYFIYDRLIGVSQAVAGDNGGPRAGMPGSAGFYSMKKRLGRLLVNGLGSLCAGAAHLLPRTRWRRGRNRTLIGAVCAIMAFMVLPSLFVIPVSFTQSTFLNFPPRGFSLRWYEELLTSPIWIDAFVRSLTVALCTAALSLVIGLAAALVLTRERVPGRAAISALILAPMILPRIAIAVALFYFLARIGLVGTNVGLILGHTLISFPYVVITLTASLGVYNRALDEAAWTLGAPWRTLLHVTLPMIRDGIIAAAIFAFMTSLDDLSIALFVAGGEQTTLPKQMWSTMVLQATPVLAAASTLILVVMTGFALGGEALRRRAR